MPPRSSDVLASVGAVDDALIELDRAVRRGDDEVSMDEIGSALSTFNEAVEALRSLLGVETAMQPGPGGGARPSEGAGPSEPTGEEKGQDFSEFFATVAESVVDAQKQLDLKSKDYLRYQKELAQQSDGFRAMPSLFRIPKVSADIKFAMEAEKSRRVGLIFFSDTARATTQHQQSLQFEITAVPPSPEQSDQIMREEPQLALVLAPGARERIFEAMAAVPMETNASRDEQKKLLDPNNRDRVLMIPGGPDSLVFLFYAEPGDTKHLGLWQLIVTEESSRLEQVYKFSRSPVHGEVREDFKRFVLALAERQAKFLSKFK